MRGALSKFKAIGLLLSTLFALIACDAGPSAVMPDGEGKSPTQYETQQKPPVWADQAAKPQAAAPDEAIEEAQTEPQTGPQPTTHYGPAQASAKAVPIKSFVGQKQSITATKYGEWPLWSSNRKYSASDNASYHFDKHAAELGITDYETYVAFVHGFVHNPPKGTQTLMRNNGDTLYYNPDYNIFAVTTKKGAPRTLFRPDNGAAYWQKQKQAEANRRTLRNEG